MFGVLKLVIKRSAEMLGKRLRFISVSIWQIRHKKKFNRRTARGIKKTGYDIGSKIKTTQSEAVIQLTLKILNQKTCHDKGSGKKYA